jgi:hypothetical protein
MLRSRAPAIFVSAFVLAFALCVGATPFRAMAQGEAQSDTLKAANELLAVMSKDTVRQMVTGMTAQVWPAIEQALRAKRSNIDQATLTELRSEYERIQMQHMAGVMAEAPALYARYFSAEELRDMLAFYKTPTGLKSLQVMPQLTTEVFKMVMSKMQGLQVQIMDAFNAALRQRGIDL